MALIQFENYPSTNTKINATNLNNNFNELNSNIGDLSGLETVDKSNVVDAINELSSSLEFKDYTTQCTFHNCTLESGKIMKFGRLVIIQIQINPTITNSWAQICTIPNELHPLAIQDNGTAIIGCDFWVYNDNGIMGGITSGRLSNIVGIYLSQA